MNYYIKNIEYYLPEKIIDNTYLHEKCGVDIAFLEEKIGIKKRHIATPEQTTTDMAVKAALSLFQKNNIQPNNIDLLLLCTQHPDYLLPTTACIIQHQLNLPQTSIAFDINLGCSGFVYAAAIAGNFIKTGMANNALLIMADQYSKHIDYNDKNNAAIFGDAASAILLEKNDRQIGFIDFVFGTNGQYFDKLIIPNSGVAYHPDKTKTLFMDGREIFKFSVTVVPKNINELLQKNNLVIDDIDYFILHQANKYMLTEIQKKLNIPSQKMIIDLEDYGNTVSSTIPIAYKNLLTKKQLTSGSKIIFCGFGVGLSWASTLYIHP